MLPNPMPHKGALVVASLVPLAAIAFAFALGPSPERARREAAHEPAARPRAADPLGHGGEDPATQLIADAVRRDLPRRREAMQRLGAGAHRAALPALERILEDESEEDYVRADALVAILRIDRPRGLALAQAHGARPDLLGYSAKGLAASAPPVAVGARPAD